MIIMSAKYESLVGTELSFPTQLENWRNILTHWDKQTVKKRTMIPTEREMNGVHA